MAIFNSFSFFILIFICATLRSYGHDESTKYVSNSNNKACSKNSAQDLCKAKANDDESDDVDIEELEFDEVPVIINIFKYERVIKFKDLLITFAELLRQVDELFSRRPPESVVNSYLGSSESNFALPLHSFFQEMYSLFGAMMFNYYIKLIPTVIERMDGYFFYTNQFSVTKFEKHLAITEGDSGMPGIFFSYELSPLMVKRVVQRKSLSHLIMTVLSYISGVYIAALLVDSFVHKTVKYVQKLEIGKQS